MTETLNTLWTMLDRHPGDLPPDAAPSRRLALLLERLGSVARWADAVDTCPDHRNARNIRRTLRARVEFLALPTLAWLLALRETRESVEAMVRRDLEADFPPEERGELFRQPASAWVPGLAEWAGVVAVEVRAEAEPQAWLSIILTTCCLFLAAADASERERAGQPGLRMEEGE